jgi:hypothetical protein
MTHICLPQARLAGLRGTKRAISEWDFIPQYQLSCTHLLFIPSHNINLVVLIRVSSHPRSFIDATTIFIWTTQYITDSSTYVLHRYTSMLNLGTRKKKKGWTETAVPRGTYVCRVFLFFYKGNKFIWRRYQLHQVTASTRCLKTSRIHTTNKKIKREI